MNTFTAKLVADQIAKHTHLARKYAEDGLGGTAMHCLGVAQGYVYAAYDADVIDLAAVEAYCKQLGEQVKTLYAEKK